MRVGYILFIFLMVGMAAGTTTITTFNDSSTSIKADVSANASYTSLGLYLEKYITISSAYINVTADKKMVENFDDSTFCGNLVNSTWTVGNPATFNCSEGVLYFKGNGGDDVYAVYTDNYTTIDATSEYDINYTNKVTGSQSWGLYLKESSTAGGDPDAYGRPYNESFLTVLLINEATDEIKVIYRNTTGNNITVTKTIGAEAISYNKVRIHLIDENSVNITRGSGTVSITNFDRQEFTTLEFFGINNPEGYLDNMTIAKIGTSTLTLALDVGDNKETSLNTTLTPSVANKTDILTDLQNSIQTCTWDIYGNCTLPLKLYSTSGTTLTMDSLEINYTESIWLTNCSTESGVTSPLTLRYDIYWENATTTPFPNVTFKQNYDVTGTPTNREYNFSQNNQSFYDVCIDPDWVTYTTDATIEYSGTGTDTRYYFLDAASINNVSTNISLYLLPSALSTLITFTVYDSKGHLTSDILVEIQLWDTALGWITVANFLSDTNGNGYAELQTGKWYRYILKQDGTVLETYSKTRLESTSVPLHLPAPDSMEIYEYFDKIATTCPCTYTNATKMLSCSATDTSGLSSNYRFLVERRVSSGWSTVCDNSSVSTSPVMYCELSNITEKNYYRYTFAVDKPLTTYILCLRTIEFQNAPIFGGTGVFMGTLLILLLVSAGVAVGNPALVVVMLDIGLITAYFLDWIRINTSILILWILFSGVIIVILGRGKS